MKKLISKILIEAEQLLQDKKHPEALSKLVGVEPSSLTGRDYGYYCLLITEASLRTGHYSTIRIDDAIEVFRFSQETEKFARAKYLKGWYLSTSGRFPEAKETLLEAYANYLRCNKLYEAAGVLNRLSFVAHHTGNIESAINNLKKCLDIFDRIGDEPNSIRIARNIAFLYYEAGNLQEALSVYSAHPVSVTKHGVKDVLIAYSMSAIPHALKGDIATAKKTIEKCKPYLDKYVREKAIYFENLGLISILDHDYKAAEKALTSGLDISLEIAPESALVSQIKRLFGDLYVAMSGTGMDSRFHGNEKDASFLRKQESSIALAEKYTSEALAVAEKINERVEISACWRVFARVEQHRGHDATAREWYKKAIDLFNLIGSRYELAVTRYLAATSGLYANAERIAMLYLAREYFESEDVRHYVEKIDVQLRRTQWPRRKVTKSEKPGIACPTIIAVNPQMKKLVEFAEHVAESEMTVLLTGATGTGKDIFAHYIHYHSGRPGEFVAVNAAAIPDTMIEAELFGSVKGAFTGSTDRPGLFEQAEKGTFYLDEIADASAEFQVKLLRVLESRVVRRLGENKTRKVDFRLIAASNHDLRQRMRDNLFRLDLYHRLNEICIDLPPLGQRKGDISALVEHFLTFAGFDLSDGNAGDIERLGRILARHRWPGNVRQLRTEVSRLWLLAKSDVGRMLELAQQSTPESERDELLEVLAQAGGNQTKAARLLDVSEGSIRYRMRKYCIKNTD